MTPHPRSRIRTRTQLRDLPLGRTTPLKVPDFSKCRFSVSNFKFDSISDGGCTREKQIQKALGSLPPCGNRGRFSESAICSSRVRPPSEIKSNSKFKALRWRPLRWRLTLSESSLKGKRPFSRKNARKKGHFPLIAWEKSHVARVENRGSLISVPGALCRVW